VARSVNADGLSRLVDEKRMGLKVSIRVTCKVMVRFARGLKVLKCDWEEKFGSKR
jgi:hypothetical protein